MLARGTNAPDFELADSHGQPFRLAHLRNKWVVLWWYPEANSSGCSIQAASLRDSHDDIKAHGARVVGISFNTIAENDSFACDKELPFTLVADPERVVGLGYEVIREPGEPYAAKPRRITYYVDPDGVIAHSEVVEREWLNEYGTHVIQVLEQLQQRSA